MNQPITTAAARIIHHLHFCRNLCTGKPLPRWCANYSPRPQVFASGGEQFRPLASEEQVATPCAPNVWANGSAVHQGHFFTIEPACPVKNEEHGGRMGSALLLPQLLARV